VCTSAAASRTGAPPAGSRRSRFTLVETLLAVALLAVVMIMAFRFYGGTERIWRATRGLAEIYESARILFGVVTRDLQCAMAEGEATPDRHIRFHQESGRELWFVTVGEPAPEAKSRCLEVAYRIEDFRFVRAFRDDTSTDWSIHAPRDRLDSSSVEHTLASGVMDQRIVCYAADGAEWTTPSTADVETGLPAAVSISLTLLDSKSFERWQTLPAQARDDLVKKRSRTVTKRVLLGRAR